MMPAVGDSDQRPRRQTGRVVVAFAVAVAAVVAVSAQARADATNDRAAKRIVDKAATQYNLGHFADSSDLFEKAYQLDPAPILLFNIGQCQRRLGDNDRALFFYRRYLDVAPAAEPHRAEVERLIAELELSVRQQAELKNRPPPGVGGAVVADGNSPQSQESAGTTPSPLPPAAEPPEDDSSRQVRRNIAWIAGGVAAASLVFAAIEALVWSNRAARFDDHVGPSATDPTVMTKNCGGDVAGHGGAGCDALYNDLSSARTLAIVGFATAGVLAAGSAVLFLTSPPGASQVAAACAPNLYAAGVVCRLSF